MKKEAMRVELQVTAPLALFSNPLSKISGEKQTYLVPTYGAVKGVLGSVYLKPTFYWVVDKIRIMNPIRTEARGVLLPHYSGGQADMASYLYLKNVCYQISAHAEWNMNLPRYTDDRDPRKHQEILKKAIRKGGRLPITLGPSECPAEIEAVPYSTGKGYYDGIDMDFGVMQHCVLHSTEGYNDLTRNTLITVHFWECRMVNGEIHFPRPEECKMVRPLIRRNMA